MYESTIADGRFFAFLGRISNFTPLAQNQRARLIQA